jgi:hypothetical protein
LEYGAIEGESGIDVVLIENRREEEDWRSPLVPIGVIHRRIEPVPEGDMELTFDAVSVQPTPEPSFVNVLLPSEGLLTPAVTRPLQRSRALPIYLQDRWSQFEAAFIGTISKQPPTEASPWRLRMHVASRELLRTDDLGPRYVAWQSFGADPSGHPGLSVDIRPDPANPRDVSVPVLRRLEVTGRRLQDVRIEAHGAYE